MRVMPFAFVLPILAGGCVRTVATVVTAPVKVVSKGVDWTTTSRSEADRNYGRKMRKAEEREGRERKGWAKRCRGHQNEPDCREYTGFRADSVR